jgi:hypothetical protein
MCTFSNKKYFERFEVIMAVAMQNTIFGLKLTDVSEDHAASISGSKNKPSNEQNASELKKFSELWSLQW